MSEMLLAPERTTRRCGWFFDSARNRSRREPKSSNIKAAVTSCHRKQVLSTISTLHQIHFASHFIILLLPLPNCQTHLTFFITSISNKFNMQYFTVVATLFASVALSSPVEVQERQLYIPCSGLYGTAQCCATDVLGVADLNCANPPAVPANASEFQAECSAIGQQARCCVLPIVRVLLSRGHTSRLRCRNARANNTS